MILGLIYYGQSYFDGLESSPSLDIKSFKRINFIRYKALRSLSAYLFLIFNHQDKLPKYQRIK
ncbi:hypothetical protein [Borreliella garinii]|uniref:hypothetical protein n=1 Tax=Borreliella garinii TaxID=29519 RepID=UPI0004D9AE91|nr:hypothetical protein [Borreliella garinii]KEO61911.1 hypothetical protein DM10_05455 [Borreliella garinii]KEO61918.1 hypothetical protein DM10_05520 [Borreliella garinii]